MKTISTLGLSVLVVMFSMQLFFCEKDTSSSNLVSGGDSDTDTDTDADTDADGDSDGDGDNDGDSDGDSDSDAGESPDPETCAEDNFKIEGQIVDMLIVLDRSNSMKMDGLWGPMGNALTEVTAQMNQQINFGLLLFPAQNCSGITNQCAAPTNVRVHVGDPDAATKIAGEVGTGGAGTCGGTPTAKTLQTALTYLDGVNDENKRYVLLATDGAPNCNYSLNCGSCTTTHTLGTCANAGQCLDDAATCNAAAQLAAAEYPVYVLGMGGSAKWANVMNAIAAAGGTSQYYAVNNTAQLLQTLESITGAIVSCEFDVKWDELPSGTSKDPTKVNFYCKENEDDEANDQNVVGLDEGCQNGTGWEWVDDNTVRFCDQACEDLKSHSCGVVTATFGCESIPVR